MTSPSSEHRDVGPYTSAEQAMRQFENWSAWMPMPSPLLAEICIKEALLATKVAMPQFELETLEKAMQWDPLLAQIVAGWIFRAYDSGRRAR